MKQGTALFFFIGLLSSFFIVRAESDIAQNLPPAPDYSNSASWIIRNDKKPAAKQEFDIFYIYPTLTADKNHPYMDLRQPAMKNKADAFVRAQTGLFTEHARIFAPFVRQLEYTRVKRLQLEKSVTDGSPETGILDTISAFRYYFKHYRAGRPYILIGHSQGAMNLYELLRRCPEISPDNGFVAAYLPGLPHITADDVRRELSARGIRPAAGRTDIGVIIGWNTQNAESSDTIFAGPGILCINPLNWSVDALPAPASMNVETVFYNIKSGKITSQKNFVGACVDPKRGIVLVNLPSMSKFDARGFMGKGVFHMNDIWFFAGNIRENMLDRVRAAAVTPNH